MKNITYLAISLIFISTFNAKAMERIEEHEEDYEYTTETFSVNHDITVTILTFYVKGDDKEVGYIDYQVNKHKKIAFIRMFVCPQADEMTKTLFFLALEKHMSKKDQVKTVLFYANSKEEEFYKKFNAARHPFDSDYRMKMTCEPKRKYDKAYYIESPK